MSSPVGHKRSADNDNEPQYDNNNNNDNNTQHDINTPPLKKSRFSDNIASNTTNTSSNDVTTNGNTIKHNNNTSSTTSTSSSASASSTTATSATQQLAQKQKAIAARLAALKQKQQQKDKDKQHAITPTTQQQTTTNNVTTSSTQQTESSKPTAVTVQQPEQNKNDATTQQVQQHAQSSAVTDNPYLPTAYDNTQRYRSLTIHSQPGKGTSQALAMRLKQLNGTRNKQLVDSRPNLPYTVLQYIQSSVNIDNVPTVEHWDEQLLIDINNGYNDDNINANKLTSHIYHPVELPVVGEPTQPSTYTAPLTRKERIKLKKRRKAAEHKEKQDRIRLGLEAPPEPKLRQRNLHNTLFLESVADPSALEHKVKQQVQDRLNKHIQDNKNRQLKKQQKIDKQIHKYTNDIEQGIICNVYKTIPFNNKQIRFKININAQQYQLTGMCVMINDNSNNNEQQHVNNNIDNNNKFYMIIAEGGKKALRHYNRLLTRRINWKKAIVNDDEQHMSIDNDNDDEYEYDSDDNDNHNQQSNITTTYNPLCELVWSGPIQDKSFNKFITSTVNSDIGMRKLLERYGVEQYYHTAKSYVHT